MLLLIISPRCDNLDVITSRVFSLGKIAWNQATQNK